MSMKLNSGRKRRIEVAPDLEALEKNKRLEKSLNKLNDEFEKRLICHHDDLEKEIKYRKNLVASASIFFFFLGLSIGFYF